jgi:hypothetical protein
MFGNILEINMRLKTLRKERPAFESEGNHLI